LKEAFDAYVCVTLCAGGLVELTDHRMMIKPVSYIFKFIVIGFKTNGSTFGVDGMRDLT
jgi:hypothetical protein